MPAIITIVDQETVIVVYGVEAAKALTDAGLEAIETATTEATGTIAAALSAVETLEAAASASAAAAAASEAAVADAVEVYRQVHEVEVEDDGGLEAGGWYFTRNTPHDLRISRFIGQVIGGSGTAAVSVVDGSDVVYGPITLSTTQTVNDGLGFLIPAGSSPSFFYEDVSGTVTAVHSKIEGLPE